MEQDDSVYSCDQEYFLDLCRSGEIDQLKDFINNLPKQFDWQWTTNSYDNFIHMLSANNHYQIYDYLLPIIKNNISQQKFKLLINCSNSTKNTPLHYAVINSSIEMVQRLINDGADPNIKNQFNRTPLNQAEDFGIINIAEILAPVTTIDIEQLKKYTAGLVLNNDSSDQQQQKYGKIIQKQIQEQEDNKKQQINSNLCKDKSQQIKNIQ